MHDDHHALTKARLVYVVGASGSGKDSLIRYARARLASNPAVVFAHRYITREADAGGENHVALSAAEFATRRRTGLFALDWESHGHAYGIGIEINQWLSRGVTVVVNGSREYLPEVQMRYPELLIVWINVSLEVLRDRLNTRGRENAAAIEARLDRHRNLQDQKRFGTTICNNGELAEGGEALVDLILQCYKLDFIHF
jgi:ribose 1,5-bisphosphokinase